MSKTQEQIDAEINDLAEKMAKSTTDSKQLLFDTILELGPEALKKASETLTEPQKVLLKSALAEIKKSKEDLTPKKDETKASDMKQESNSGSDDEDEKLLMDNKNAEHPHQGGPKDKPEGWDGEVIKSAGVGGEGSKGGKVIGHTKSGKPVYDSADHSSHADFSTQDHYDARDMHPKGSEERAKHVAYLSKKAVHPANVKQKDGITNKQARSAIAASNITSGMDAFKKSDDKAVENLIQIEEAEHNKDLNGDGKIAEKMEKTNIEKSLEEIVSLAKACNMSKEDVIKAIKDNNQDLELVKAEMKKKMDAPQTEPCIPAAPEQKTEEKKDEPKIEKSIDWNMKNTLAAGSLGRNTHWNVDAFIVKSEEERQDTLKKGAYLNETSGETLQKSEGQKPDLNDMIEKGFDYSTNEIKRIEGIQNHKIEGTLVKSFHDEDIAKALGISPEEYKKIFGE